VSPIGDTGINRPASANAPAVRIGNQVQINPPPPPPRAWNPGDYIIGGDPNYPYISFSFDDVPSHTVSRDIMSAFERAGLPGRASFFAVGSIAYIYDDVMREMVNRKFEIMNHSMTHTYNIHTNVNEIDPMNNLISSFTGYTPELYRGPGGGYNDYMLQSLANRGMAFLWTGSDMNDWTSPRLLASSLVSNFSRAAVPGAHILLHGSNTHQQTALAVPQMIQIARDRGLEVLSPSEHMRIGNLQRRALQLQSTELQIAESLQDSEAYLSLDKNDQQWIQELKTVLEESTHLSAEKRQYIENEIKSREELVAKQ
jgi:peptidoglycan/xylan/chitin deacetylase (PgdA/CDA1 family)